MRKFLVIGVIAVSLSSGCGADPSPQTPDETPEQAATRVFAIAQKLEREDKNKDAFEAYRQVAEHFPGTPEGKKASARIRLAQKGTSKKPKSKQTP